MISLDRALERLLARRDLRVALAEGRDLGLPLDPLDLAALRAIDPAQLDAIAGRMRDDLKRRSYRGSPSLLVAFAETIEGWRAAHPSDADLDAMMTAFMESAAYGHHREYGQGWCLEESFYRFCEEASIGARDVREREYCFAAARALALNPRPAFSIPGGFTRCPGGYFAISGTTLFAAVLGNFVSGELTPFLCDLLREARDPAPVIRRHGVSAEVAKRSLERLVELGLLGSEIGEP